MAGKAKVKTTGRQRSEFLWGWLFILPTVIGLVVLNIIPIFQTIYQSFFKTGDFGKGNIFIGFENYKKVFGSAEIWQALINTFKYAIVEVPFSICIARLQEIPHDYYEAAEIDGATGVKCFFNITIPLLSPTIFFVMITRIIGSLQVFDLIYMVMEKSNPALEKTQSLVFLFYKYTFTNKNVGYGSTIVILLLLITLIITAIQMVAQKKWVFYN